MPLACDAPALVIWERVLRRGRAALCALPGVHCPPPKPLAGLCGQWTPLAIGTCLCAALLVLVWALVVLCRPLRWCAHEQQAQHVDTHPALPGCDNTLLD